MSPVFTEGKWGECWHRGRCLELALGCVVPVSPNVPAHTESLVFLLWDWNTTIDA